jgi:hypothetical protein
MIRLYLFFSCDRLEFSIVSKGRACDLLAAAISLSNQWLLTSHHGDGSRQGRCTSRPES